jgi:protein-S-isoprenylcysteine O-methyltransferase Ste14
MLMPLLVGITHREALGEEERLLEAFGPDYGAYQAQVRRYL